MGPHPSGPPAPSLQNVASGRAAGGGSPGSALTGGGAPGREEPAGSTGGAGGPVRPGGRRAGGGAGPAGRPPAKMEVLTAPAGLGLGGELAWPAGAPPGGPAARPEDRREPPAGGGARGYDDLAGMDPWLLRQVAGLVESPQGSPTKSKATPFQPFSAEPGPAGGGAPPMPASVDPWGVSGRASRRQTLPAQALSSTKAMELVKALEGQDNGPRLHATLDMICDAARKDANNAALLTELGALHALIGQLKSNRHDLLIQSKMQYATDVLMSWILDEIPAESQEEHTALKTLWQATTMARPGE